MGPRLPVAPGIMSACDYVVCRGRNEDWLSRNAPRARRWVGHDIPAPATRERDMRELLLGGTD